MGFKVSKIQRRDWKTSYASTWKKDYKRDVVALGGFTCQECKRPGTKSNPIQRDHIINKAKGGSDARINLRRLCYQCHRKRHPRQRF